MELILHRLIIIIISITRIMGDLILEEANDDQTCYYYRVEENGYSFVKNYLGFTDDQYGFGIFDDDYEGFPSRNENGVIELDSEMC